MSRSEFCPECNALLDFDEVDIGVGTQRGNYRCPECGWEPASQHDLPEDAKDLLSGPAPKDNFPGIDSEDEE